MSTKTLGTPTPMTSISGTIAVAGTAQTVLTANPRRSYLLFQNISPNLMMLTIAGMTPSATVGIALPQYARYEATSAIPNGPIQVWCATAAGSFYAVDGN